MTEIETKQLVFSAKSAEQLKTIVNTVIGLVKEVQFTADQNGIHCASMDPANVAHISVDWSKDDFIEYKVPAEGFTFIVDLNHLKKAIKRASASDTLHTIVTTDKAEFILDDGATKRTFQIPLIDDDSASKKTPDLNFNTKVNLPCDKWMTAVEDVAEYEHSTQMLVNEGVFTIQAWNDGQTQHTKVDFREGEQGITIESSEFGGASMSKYSTEYFKRFLEPAKKADNVTVEWTKDYPCRVSYELENLKFAFVLAPRVDND